MRCGHQCENKRICLARKHIFRQARYSRKIRTSSCAYSPRDALSFLFSPSPPRYPKSCRGSQEGPAAGRSSQDSQQPPGAARSSRKEQLGAAGGSRQEQAAAGVSSQQQPGAARSSQQQPGAGRSSRKEQAAAVRRRPLASWAAGLGEVA